MRAFESKALVVLLAALLGACAAQSSPQFGNAPVHSDLAHTLDGRVIGVGLPSPDEMRTSDLHIEVRPGEEQPVTVRLAPGWYLDQHGLHFSREDHVTVTGKYEGDRSVFVARRIKKGDTEVDLRDEQGRPVWERPDPQEAAPHAGEPGPDPAPPSPAPAEGDSAPAEPPSTPSPR